MKYKTLGMNQNWRFCLGGEWKEEKVEKVCLPHPVTVTPANSSGGRNYQGKCIYKKTVFIPEEWRGKKLILEFEGLMGVSDLFINGRAVASHYCGYTPFVIDLSDEMNFGADNELTVHLDNSDNPEVPPGKPQSVMDFTYEGGIYREAKLDVCEPLYITHPLLANEVAGGGIFVHYENVSHESAEVYVKVHTKNEFAEDKDYTLRVTLLDAEGKTVATTDVQNTLAAGEARYDEPCFVVEKPNLWSIHAPYLYTVRCQILCDGEELYTKDTEIGIRTFYFTLEDGVIFNGESHRFRGDNYHQTWPHIGNAVPGGLLARDMMKLKEMGSENVRSHYPFSHYADDACNRIGMTMIVANPGWQFVRPGIFLERAYQNMRDIVRWKRNNPCVLIWEPILNEAKMTYQQCQELHDLVHEEYPYTDCFTASDCGPTDITYLDYMVNMIGYKNYEPNDHCENTPKWTREYGDAPDNFVDHNTVWRTKRGHGDYPQVESINRLLGKYQDAEVRDAQTKTYAMLWNDKTRCGYGIWPGISHNRGMHINPCYGGHLDLFRLPKFSYYFMKSQVDRERIGDVLFIANWWSDVSPDDVMILSNAERVELICDGVQVGVQTPDVNEYPVPHPPFTFKGVRKGFKKRFDYDYNTRSTLEAIAYVGDEVVARTFAYCPGVPRQLELEADLMDMPLYANGGDVVAVRCKQVDRFGVVSPVAGDVNPVYFEVEGEGTIIGDETVLANPVFPEAGIATVLIRTTTKPGDIKIKASLYYDRFTDGSHERSAVCPGTLTLTSIAPQQEGL